MDQLVTPETLADEMGLSARLVIRWTEAADPCPHVRLGKRIYFRPQVVSDWVVRTLDPGPLRGHKDGSGSIPSDPGTFAAPETRGLEAVSA